MATANQRIRLRFTVSCIVFLVILLDSQFSSVTFVVSQSIVELDGFSRMIVGVVADRLKVRIAVFYIVAAVTVIAAALMIYSIVKRATLNDHLAFAFSVACSIVLLTNVETIDGYGFERRCRSLLPQCQELHQRLTKDWPNRDGELPYAGPFYTYEDHPNLLLLPTRRPSAFAESLGNSIERSEDGAMRFQVCGIRQAYIEYHPESQSPHTFRNCRGVQMTHREHKQLGEKWYLCLYHESQKPSASI